MVGLRSLLLLCALLGLPGVEVIPLPPVIELDDEMEPLPGGNIPGREQPASLPDPVALTFVWDDYRTRVVVAPATTGKGLRSPAWVVTYSMDDQVVVAYRATAFRDKTGLLHIDARNAIITGPRRSEWSPDSFSIAPDGSIQAIDDKNRGNGGTVTETVQPQDPAYRRMLLIAMAIVREAL